MDKTLKNNRSSATVQSPRLALLLLVPLSYKDEKFLFKQQCTLVNTRD